MCGSCPGFAPPGRECLALFFLVGRRRLRRSARRLVRSLKLHHQLNQLVLAQPLQISAIHAHMDSEIGVPGKATRISGAAPPIAAPKMGVGNYADTAPPQNSQCARLVIAEFVGIVGEPTIVRLMPRLRPARTGVLSCFSFSCRWMEASTNCATSCPVAEAGAPAQSTPPCSAAANQSDPCAHGLEIGVPGKATRISGAVLPIAAPKMGGNYTVNKQTG